MSGMTSPELETVMKLEKVNENPSITISSRDYDQLERIAMAGIRTRRHAYVAQFLADELERAAVLPLPQMSEKVVKIYSDVTFRDDATCKFRRVTLVYPGEEDVALGRISLLTPIGAALIGLSEGQTIGWRTATGEPHRLTVMKVHSEIVVPTLPSHDAEDAFLAECINRWENEGGAVGRMEKVDRES
jgi:regulator of nucleoside diphosphate kinase